MRNLVSAPAARRGMRAGWAPGALAMALLAASVDCSTSADRPPASPDNTDGSLPGNGEDAANPSPTATPGDSAAPNAPDATLDATSSGDAEGDAGQASSMEAAAIPPMEAGVEAGPDAPVVVGACSPANDEAGVSLMMCGTQCVNVLTDNNNCGGCNQPCTGIVGALCIGGTCACPAPQSNCGGECVDTTQDGTNCGYCGHNCTGSTCAGGLCKAGQIAQTVQAGVLPETVSAGIAVDSSNVYWTQSAGTGTEPGVFQQAFSGGAPTGPWPSPDPRGLVVTGHGIYWTDYSSGTVNQGSLIAGPGGGQTALSTSATGHPLAVSTDGKNIYWADTTAGTINQLALQGAGTPLVLATNQSYPIAIAVDSTYVYWIDSGTIPNSGSVNRATIGQASSAKQIAGSENQPCGIALSPPFTAQTATPPAATTVYWTNQTNPGTVKSAPAGATNVAMPTIIAQNQPAPYGIAVDGEYVYWTNFDGNNVVKAPLAGGTAYVIAAGQSVAYVPTSIAVDSVNVYWANKGNGTIFKVPK